MKANVIFIEKVCKSKCELYNGMDSLNQCVKKLETLAYQLRLLIHNHTLTKRGLLNIVGSISKSLFGTLDNDDLDLINANIDKLFQKGNELKTIVANQTALIRKIIKSNSIKLIDEVRVKFDEYIPTIYQYH